ncbi:hypothetical protein ACFVAJ_18775 [Agromyces sp. NPDC057679]|uniref:hypothetical protein n=1 Tax=Agromyces sp. NPDC057679 TaxID=3346207 RepID=UPI00366FA64D
MSDTTELDQDATDKIISKEIFEGLEDGTICVLWSQTGWIVRKSVYQLSLGNWSLLNPEEPDDRTYPHERLWLIAAVRDRRHISVAWDPRDPGAVLTTAAEVDSLPRYTVIVSVDEKGWASPIMRMGDRWIPLADNDDFIDCTSEQLLGGWGSNGYTLHRGWDRN